MKRPREEEEEHKTKLREGEWDLYRFWATSLLCAELPLEIASYVLKPFVCALESVVCTLTERHSRFGHPTTSMVSFSPLQTPITDLLKSMITQTNSSIDFVYNGVPLRLRMAYACPSIEPGMIAVWLIGTDFFITSTYHREKTLCGILSAPALKFVKGMEVPNFPIYTVRPNSFANAVARLYMHPRVDNIIQALGQVD